VIAAREKEKGRETEKEGGKKEIYEAGEENLMT